MRVVGDTRSLHRVSLHDNLLRLEQLGTHLRRAAALALHLPPSDGADGASWSSGGASRSNRQSAGTTIAASCTAPTTASRTTTSPTTTPDKSRLLLLCRMGITFRNSIPRSSNEARLCMVVNISD